eukprot:Lithocolla_globosa_v1_NODE_6632_length_1057_cov_45.277445.p3 type:complete len:111 gc:universal NODE_6632_length_1057_cov_45.277445:479-811(+)
MEMSSKRMLKDSPRSDKLLRIFSLTCSRMVINSAASCSATIDLRISFPIEGKTRSSYASPNSAHNVGKFATRGLCKTRRVMLIICMSLLGVFVSMRLGRVRTSIITGRWM